MKSKLLLTVLILVFGITAWAQTYSGYIPFHEYLLRNHGNIQKLTGANARDVAFEKIGFAHYAYDFQASPGAWESSDSGVYSYYDADSIFVVETGGLYSKFNTSFWFTSALDTFSSNNLGEIDTMTHEVYDTAGNGTWTNSYRYVYTYNTTNPFGYLYTELLQTWNGSNWVDSAQYTYTYDTTNEMVASITFASGSGLQNDSQYIYSYSGYNNTTLLTQTWSGSAWVSAYKQENSFNAQGNNKDGFIYQWNGTGWNNYAFFNKGYDLLNEMVSYDYNLWNSDSLNYINNYSEVYAYTLGNATQFANYNWNTATNTWTPIALNTYSFDVNHNCVFEQDAAYSNTADSIQNTDLYYYYYNTFEVSGISNIKNQLDFGIYPNPSTGSTFISLTTQYASGIGINIYDANGKLVKHMQTGVAEGNTQIPLNLKNCAAGNYYVELIDNTGKTGVVKYVKQ